MHRILLPLLLSLGLVSPVVPATAFSTAGCHCFRHRSYDPANRFAADDYLVATTFNSLIAAGFHISKRKIVMMKMESGIYPDDLLIGLYLAKKSGRDPDLLLSVRENGGSWRRIMASAGLAATGDDPVLRALTKGADDGRLAGLITDTLITTFFPVDKKVIADLHGQGFDGRQITVICALAGHAGIKPAKIAAMYREKKMSWSEIAARYRLTPREVGRLIA